MFAPAAARTPQPGHRERRHVARPSLSRAETRFRPGIKDGLHAAPRHYAPAAWEYGRLPLFSPARQAPAAGDLLTPDDAATSAQTEPTKCPACAGADQLQ